MSIPTLCPFCTNNTTCRSPVTIRVMTELAEADTDTDTKVLFAGLPGDGEKRSNCAVLENALKRAVERHVDTLTLVVPDSLPAQEARALGAVINCRTILHLNHKVSEVELAEIRILCSPEQKEPLLEGLAHSHPLCLNCFERCQANASEEN